ncbi:hypothetical protein JCM6882_005656 [Rhodosporidiobolus microsporus]
MLGPVLAVALAAGASSAVAVPLNARAAPTVVQNYTTTAGTTYSYDACYSDLAYGTRALPMGVATSARTVEACLNACAANKYTLCGVEYHGECWGGNALDVTSTKQAESACNLECWDAPGQVCGGTGGSTNAAMNLYRVNAAPVTTTTTTTTTTSTTSASTTTTTTTTTSPAAPTATGPSVLQNYTTAAGAYSYQGCHSDLANGVRALALGVSTSKRTVESCLDACAAQKYKFCGVEYHGECWGANTLDSSSTKQNESACDLTCWDNPLQVCGGVGGDTKAAMNLYSLASSEPTTTTTTLAPVVTPPSNASNVTTSTTTTTSAAPLPTGPSILQSYNSTSGSWAYQECYSDLVNGRALPNGLSTKARTVESCLDACDGAGYSLCGIEYHGECWGANELGAGSTIQGAGACKLTCWDNANQICGGQGGVSGAAMNLYKLSGSNNTIPAPSSNSSTIASTKLNTESWSYSGCYEDLVSNVRTLPHMLSSAWSTSACLDAAEAANYTVAGVTHGGECWAANALNPTAKNVTVESCDWRCDNDKEETCGADKLLDIYVSKTPVLAPGHTLEEIKTYANWTYNNCYSDRIDIRSLPISFENADGTAESCLDTCEQNGAKVCGLSYYGECYGGAQLKSIATVLPEERCAAPCGGSSQQICGGAEALSIFDLTTRCAPHYRPSFEEHRCIPCGEADALTCTETESLTCENGFLLNGTCLETCPAKYHNDVETHTCVPCSDSDALTCPTTKDVATSCETNYLYQGKCVAACPAQRFFQDAEKHACVACADPDAATCSASASVATSCSTRYLLNGQCVLPCPSGMFANASPRQCIACTSRFEGAATCSSSGPASCLSGYVWDPSMNACITTAACSALSGGYYPGSSAFHAVVIVSPSTDNNFLQDGKCSIPCPAGEIVNWTTGGARFGQWRYDYGTYYGCQTCTPNAYSCDYITGKTTKCMMDVYPQTWEGNRSWKNNPCTNY